MGQIFSKYVNNCIAFWSQNASLFSNFNNNVLNSLSSGINTGFEISVFNDPANGNNIGGYNGGDEKIFKKQFDEDGCLVVMGFNPAGTITKAFPSCHTIVSNHPPLSLSARNINNFDIVNIYNPYVVNPIQDLYTKAIDDFANQCGYGNNYAKIDAFGLLQSAEDVLKKDIKKSRRNHTIGKYEDVLRLSISTIIEMKPKVIVFANAGLREFFYDLSLFPNLIKAQKPITPNCAWKIELYSGTPKPQLAHTCWGIFTCMLSGRGQLDNGSKEVIAQVVKNL